MNSQSEEEKIKDFLFKNTISVLTHEEACRIVASTVSKAVNERYDSLSGEEKEEILSQINELP